MPRELQIWDRFHRLRELAIVKHAAFRTNAFHAASYPSHDQAIMEHFLEKREWGFSNADTEQHIVVIVDTDMMGRDGEEGRALAWMRVKLPCAELVPVAEPEPEKDEEAANEVGEEEVSETSNPLARYKIPTLPLGSSLPLHLHMRKQMLLSETEHYDRTTDYCNASLATDPAFGGQGLAKWLLGWLCDIADGEGKRVYLDSTPEGAGVYRRMGFEDVGGFVTMIPGSDGGEEEYWIRCMVREARREG